LHKRTIHGIGKLLREKKLSCHDLARSIIENIDKTEDQVNAFIRVERESLLENAKALDKSIDWGDDLPELTGIPVAVKDNICTKGIPTTCASKILEGYIPVYDSTVVKKLKESGYLLIGKANMDEFAMGSSNENSFFGPVKNPWDYNRVPGGSSGGPAASVAAGEAICALGSDTGGSIRQPASLCGVVGMKPTYGLVSRYGLIAFASSLDQIGPLTKDVTDSAILLDAISGHDPDDSTSIRSKLPKYKDFLKEGIKGLKIGVPKELMVKEMDSQVRDRTKEVLDLAQEMGALIEETSLPSLEYALAVYYIIAPSEASSNLSRFDGVRYGLREAGDSTLRSMYKKTRSEGFGEEVKRRIMIGTYCLSSGYYDAYYEKAQRVRTLIINDFKKSFERFDVLISPTSPTTAFKIDEKTDDPLMMYLSDICTIPVNLAGLPAISIPSGLSNDRLPIGLQIIGNSLREDTIIRTAYNLEKAIGFSSSPGDGA